MSSRSISQEAFDSLVRENVEDLGMDPEEALADAVETLALQNVDLTGIVKCVPGSAGAGENPVVKSLHRLRTLSGSLADDASARAEAADLLDNLAGLCSVHGSDSASIATRNGGVEAVVGVCSRLGVEFEEPLVSALSALGSILHDVHSTEMFRQSGGAEMVVNILNGSCGAPKVLDGGFAVIAKAATGNEVVKELFVDLKVDELILKVMKEQTAPQSLYDAICVLLTPDDNRVVASQVFGYARKFAKLGIASSLVSTLREGKLSSSGLVSACIALKALAVNDEICRSISENGGIDAIFQSIDVNSAHNNKAVAKSCCSLLSKLAGSDDNKTAIIQKGGLDRLMKLSSRFSEDPSVLQEVMSIIGVLSLRSPENAARAVEAGAGELAIQAMQKFPAAYQMQRQACLMIRNLASRNPENRTILLSNGVEKYIRRAKAAHESCREAASDALRDLGLDNYNA